MVWKKWNQRWETKGKVEMIVRCMEPCPGLVSLSVRNLQGQGLKAKQSRMLKRYLTCYPAVSAPRPAAQALQLVPQTHKSGPINHCSTSDDSCSKEQTTRHHPSSALALKYARMFLAWTCTSEWMGRIKHCWLENDFLKCFQGGIIFFFPGGHSKKPDRQAGYLVRGHRRGVS